MISEDHQFIFVHIQKTAGKSILKALGLPPGADHRFALAQREAYGEDIWDHCFKFAIVRNPWDRLVSSYYYRVSGGNQSPADRARAKLYPRSFSRFCRDLPRFMSLEDEHMFVPQWQWISDENANPIVDYVGRFENLEQDFATICERIGLERAQLPHVNRSSHRLYWDYYDRKSRDLVAAAYETDCERFGYEFPSDVTPSSAKTRLLNWITR